MIKKYAEPRCQKTTADTTVSHRPRGQPTRSWQAQPPPSVAKCANSDGNECMYEPFAADETAGQDLMAATFARPNPDLLVIEVAGEVDDLTASALEKKFSVAVGFCPKQLLINLADVTFYSSSGISALITLRNQCREADIGLWLVTSPQVHRVLELVGLGSMFSLFDTREQAIAGLAFR